MIRLELPHRKYKATYLDAVREYKALGSDNDSTEHYFRRDLADLENDFDAFVQSLMDQHNGVNLKEGWVPSTEYWIIDDDDKYCGRISLRHRLNETLERYGGHIGSDVIPSERGKKYAEKALGLCLQEAKRRGIDEVVVTCDDKKVPSIKTIERNGGVLQDAIEHNGRLTRRYKIRL